MSSIQLDISKKFSSSAVRDVPHNLEPSHRSDAEKAIVKVQQLHMDKSRSSAAKFNSLPAQLKHVAVPSTENCADRRGATSWEEDGAQLVQKIAELMREKANFKQDGHTSPKHVAHPHRETSHPTSWRGAYSQGHSDVGTVCLVKDRLVDDGRKSLDAQVPSLGSYGHPHNCAGGCKYAWKPRGCKDGPMCTRCHICPWTRARERARTTEPNSDGTGDLQESTLEPSSDATAGFGVRIATWSL